MTTNKNTPTPRPWKVIGKNDTQVCSSAIQGASGYVVARAYHSPSSKVPYKDLWAECEANAAFIVRACNAHEELVRSLKGFVDILSTDMNQAQFVEKLMELMTTGKQAIAKAEGRAEP
jgi:hypothetical protein